MNAAMATIARGGLPAPSKPLHSPLASVSDIAWTKFVRALTVQPLGAVSASNGIGMFAHRPRRLCDLGIMSNPRSFRAPSGRQVFTADFVPPLTDIAFLRDPKAQYEALVSSTVDYARKLECGDLKRPVSMSMSVALAVLHRAGPGGLNGKLFTDTESAAARANGIF